jgi:hypothetical protein
MISSSIHFSAKLIFILKPLSFFAFFFLCDLHSVKQPLRSNAQLEIILALRRESTVKRGMGVRLGWNFLWALPLPCVALTFSSTSRVSEPSVAFVLFGVFKTGSHSVAQDELNSPSSFLLLGLQVCRTTPGSCSFQSFPRLLFHDPLVEGEGSYGKGLPCQGSSTSLIIQWDLLLKLVTSQLQLCQWIPVAFRT